MDKQLQITRKSHHVVIKKVQFRALAILDDFCKKYIYKSFIKIPGQKPGFGPVCNYFSRLFRGTEVRLHVNQLPGFLSRLKDNYIREESIEYVDADDYDITPIDINLNPKFILRPDQVAIYDYLIKDDYHTKFVGARTGLGKSLLCVAAICHFKQRAVFIIKPMYIEKWIEDFQKYTDISPTNVVRVDGSGELKALIAQGFSNTLDESIIIISNRTFANYIKDYEEFGEGILDRGYDCLPEDFFKVMGAGFYIVDEIHQEFYSTFKNLLYTHVKKFIGLSATLINRNTFMEMMYKIVAPLDTRAPLPEFTPYIKVTAVSYSFLEPRRIRTTEWGNNNYSHHVFEECVLKNEMVKRAYFEMIDNMVTLAYLKEYKPGDKLRIFASSIVMCTKLTEYLRYKHRDLTVARYVQDDPYENLLDPDIGVTTILSGGTAHDIPNLRATILTINIDSIQSNLQTVGRLRQLKDRDVKFYYIYCEQMLKHMQYHTNRRKTLAEQVASYIDLRYGKIIG